MELCRNASDFRNQYKKIRGLGRNVSALDTLKDVVKWFEVEMPEKAQDIKDLVVKYNIEL